jgi:hypothetical protein
MIYGFSLRILLINNKSLNFIFNVFEDIGDLISLYLANNILHLKGLGHEIEFIFFTKMTSPRSN